MAIDVRPAFAADVGRLEAAFEREAWPRAPGQLERYFAEQAAGLRLLVVAELEGEPAGYLNLVWDADHPPFRRERVPEIQDLNVLPSHRRRGVATRMLDLAEGRAAERSPRVGLGVGVYADYGPAHLLYSRRGYLLDGTALVLHGRPIVGGEAVVADDSLVLHMVKEVGGDR